MAGWETLGGLIWSFEDQLVRWYMPHCVYDALMLKQRTKCPNDPCTVIAQACVETGKSVRGQAGSIDRPISKPLQHMMFTVGRGIELMSGFSVEAGAVRHLPPSWGLVAHSPAPLPHLQAGLLNALGAGNLYRRWLYYQPNAVRPGAWVPASYAPGVHVCTWVPARRGVSRTPNSPSIPVCPSSSNSVPLERPWPSLPPAMPCRRR